ncbi:carbohydrate kinase [Lewinellaceae bacterium SD302]|nr:carbohydrate kinase [Lewinellaceae bacterium SD302]
MVQYNPTACCAKAIKNSTMSNSQAPLDLIAAGELLIDLISTEYADDFRAADQYRRIPGGSPANLASNLVRLGKRAGLVAGVGQDDAGSYLKEYASELGLDVSRIRAVTAPTTLILVTKSKVVSNFEAYRGADAEIQLSEADCAWVSSCKIFHTTAFALSREPARSSIMMAGKVAMLQGTQLSIDANYAPKIWPDRSEAQGIITEFLAMGALAKFSEVDYERLFEEPVDLKNSATAAKRILDLGAKLVCLTLGGDGVFVMSSEESFLLPARKVEVKDTTGAGDAFWSGFLSAYLDELPLGKCAERGRAMAELKLGVFGPLPARVSLG